MRRMALPPRSLGTCRGLVLPGAVLSQDLPWLPPALRPWPHPWSRGLPEPLAPLVVWCVCSHLPGPAVCVVGLGPPLGSWWWVSAAELRLLVWRRL